MNAPTLSRCVIAAVLAAAAAGASAGPSGKEIYESTCIACHGADGKGALPGMSSLASAKGPLAAADELLIKRIRDGYQSANSPMAMPPKGGNPSLTDEDLKAVLSYIRKRFGR